MATSTLGSVALNTREKSPNQVTGNGNSESKKKSSLNNKKSARDAQEQAVQTKAEKIKRANNLARETAQKELAKKKNELPKKRNLLPEPAGAGGAVEPEAQPVSAVSQGYALSATSGAAATSSSASTNKSSNRYLLRNQQQISQTLARSRKNTGITLPEKIASSFLPYQTGYNFTNNTQLTPEEIVELLSEKYAAEAGPKIQFNKNNPEEVITNIAKTRLHNRLSNRGTRARVLNATEKLRTIKELDNRDIRRVYNVLAKLSNNAHYPGRKILKAKMNELARNRVAAGNDLERIEIVNSRIATEIDDILHGANTPQSRLNYTTKSIIYTSIQLKEIRELFNQFRSFVTSKGYLEDPVVQERLKYILAQYALVRDRIEELIETYEVEEFIPNSTNNRAKKSPFRVNYYLHFIFPLITAMVKKQTTQSIDDMISEIFAESIPSAIPSAAPARGAAAPAGGAAAPAGNSPENAALAIIRKMMMSLLTNMKIAETSGTNLQVNFKTVGNYIYANLAAQSVPTPSAGAGQGSAVSVAVSTNFATNAKSKFNNMFKDPQFWGNCVSIECPFIFEPDQRSTLRAFDRFYQCIHVKYEAIRPIAPATKPEYIMVTIPEWTLMNDDYDTTRLLNRFRSYTFTIGYNKYTPKSFYFVNVPESSPSASASLSSQPPSRRSSFSGGGAALYHQNLREEIPAGNQTKNPITVVTERSGKYYIYGAGRKEVLTPFDMRNMLQFGLPLYILYQVDFSLREGGLPEQSEYMPDNVYEREFERSMLFDPHFSDVMEKYKEIRKKYDDIKAIFTDSERKSNTTILKRNRLIPCIKTGATQANNTLRDTLLQYLREKNVNHLIHILIFYKILTDYYKQSTGVASGIQLKYPEFVKSVIHKLLDAFVNVDQSLLNIYMVSGTKLKDMNLYDRVSGPLIDESQDICSSESPESLKKSIYQILQYMTTNFSEEYNAIAELRIANGGLTYKDAIHTMYSPP